MGVPFKSLDHSLERTAKRMHRVFFDLYALDLRPDAIPPDLPWEQVAPLVRGHVVDRDSIFGIVPGSLTVAPVAQPAAA